MNLSNFTRREVDFIRSEANFTQMQEDFFILRSKGISIEECAEVLNISVSCANVLSKKVKDKIHRVL